MIIYAYGDPHPDSIASLLDALDEAEIAYATSKPTPLHRLADFLASLLSMRRLPSLASTPIIAFKRRAICRLPRPRPPQAFPAMLILYNPWLRVKPINLKLDPPPLTLRSLISLLRCLL